MLLMPSCVLQVYIREERNVSGSSGDVESMKPDETRDLQNPVPAQKTRSYKVNLSHETE